MIFTATTYRKDMIIKLSYYLQIQCSLTQKKKQILCNFCKDKGKFDLSNYPKNSKVHDERSEMIIGKMKSKGKGFPIVQFVGLKRYIEDDNGDKKAKGIKTSHT